jgi:hypothetical protein
MASRGTERGSMTPRRCGPWSTIFGAMKVVILSFKAFEASQILYILEVNDFRRFGGWVFFDVQNPMLRIPMMVTIGLFRF